MCTSPYRVFKTGLKTDTGKDLLYFDMNYPCPPVVSVALAEKRLKVRIPPDTRYMRLVGNTQFLYRFLDVPCGKCDECRVSASKKWADRCLFEMETATKPCWFLTLTFSDEFCPQRVDKKDVSMFMKRLRKYVGEGVRFFASGEYGEKTHRPHYHLILFDCPLDDLYLIDAGRRLRGSKLIDRIWPYGGHVLADVTRESCAYVARYCGKKFGDKKGFVLMSRNPGIGRAFLDSKRDFLRLDYLPVSQDGRLLRLSLPRYCERIWPDAPWPFVKDRRVERAYNQRLLESALYGLTGERLDDYKRMLAASMSRRLEKKTI